MAYHESYMSVDYYDGPEPGAIAFNEPPRSFLGSVSDGCRRFIKRFIRTFDDAGSVHRLKTGVSLIVFVTYLLFQFAVLAAAIIDIYFAFGS